MLYLAGQFVFEMTGNTVGSVSAFSRSFSGLRNKDGSVIFYGRLCGEKGILCGKLEAAFLRAQPGETPQSCVGQGIEIHISLPKSRYSYHRAIVETGRFTKQR